MVILVKILNLSIVIEINVMEYKKGYGYLINQIIIVGEIILLNLAFYCSLYLFGEYLDSEVSDRIKLLFLVLNIAYIPTLFFHSQKFQENRIVFSHRLIQDTFKITLTQFVLFSTLLFLLKIPNFSRGYLFLFYTGYFLLITGWWLFMWVCLKRYRRSGYNFKKVLIVGSGENAEQLYEELTSEDTYGYRVLGYFDDRRVNLRINPYLGNLDQIMEYLQLHEVDELYCALAGNRKDDILFLMNYCENHLIRFFFVPSISSSISRNMKLEMIGNSPVLVNRKEPLNSYFPCIIKRMLDLIISSMMLILSPIWFLPIALMVKLSSPGPVLFKQLRTGKAGKDFWCYKFRSMRVNAASDTQQATRNDPRKTRVGDFLRRTNLDELPQFFNVFKGEMSVVGPRPHMLKHTEDYSKHIDKYMVRHYVKPGLTGWAQVNGFRGETREEWQMKKRVEYDIWYLENWSFWLDLKIIAQTGYKMLKHDQNAF